MMLTRSKERIAIDCLHCGHCSSVSVEKLPYFGLSPDASLVEFDARRLGRGRSNIDFGHPKVAFRDPAGHGAIILGALLSQDQRKLADVGCQKNFLGLFGADFQGDRLGNGG